LGLPGPARHHRRRARLKPRRLARLVVAALSQLDLQHNSQTKYRLVEARLSRHLSLNLLLFFALATGKLDHSGIGNRRVTLQMGIQLGEQPRSNIPVLAGLGNDRDGLLVVAGKVPISSGCPEGWNFTFSPIRKSNISECDRIWLRNRRRATIL